VNFALEMLAIVVMHQSHHLLESLVHLLQVLMATGIVPLAAMSTSPLERRATDAKLRNLKQQAHMYIVHLEKLKLLLIGTVLYATSRILVQAVLAASVLLRGQKK